MNSTNINHLLQKASANEWNQWKQEQKETLETTNSLAFSRRPFQKFDLSNVVFYPYSSFNDCCFIGTNLCGTILRNVTINNSNFTEANLFNADLIFSNLTDVDLSYANLINVKIIYSEFIRVKFNQCVINPQKIIYDKDVKLKFTDIECNFVYLDNSKTKRYPPTGHFVAGEFEKFIKGEIDMNDTQKNRSLLDGSNDEFRSELNSVNTEAERNRLKDEVDFLKKRLNSIELQEKIDNHKKGKPWLEVILPIFIVSIVFLGFSHILINKVDKQKIEVSVNYDVGVIMGGLLTGSAALIAALSYAKQNNKSNQSDRQ